MHCCLDNLHIIHIVKTYYLGISIIKHIQVPDLGAAALKHVARVAKAAEVLRVMKQRLATVLESGSMLNATNRESWVIYIYIYINETICECAQGVRYLASLGTESLLSFRAQRAFSFALWLINADWCHGIFL